MKINGNIQVNLTENEFCIQIHGNLSSKLWADKWGKIEEKIIQGRFSGNAFNEIKIDFSNCVWADPLPLLSMLMLLIKVKDSNKIIIVLPYINHKDEDTTKFEKGQFLKTLASQGFLEIMLKNRFVVITDKKKKIFKNDIKHFANYRYKTLYGEEVILPARVYDAAHISTAKKFVSELQNEININLNSQLSLSVYDSLTTSAYNILMELTENVIAHAYTECGQKLFGIYIRKRCGAINNNAESETTFKNALYFEKDNCPALGTDILFGSESVLEIFFIDLGIGISGSLKESFMEIKKKGIKYPVRELFFRVLKNGERAKKSRVMTAYGGLHFITRVIRENKGYVWCKDSNEWIGAFCSDIVNDNKKGVKISVSDTTRQPVGLGWCIRLPYTNDLDKLNSISYYWEEKASSHPVFTEYKKREIDFDTDYVIINDEWTEDSRVMAIPGKVDECFVLGKHSKEKAKGKYKNFVWRPSGGNSKNQIIESMKKYINDSVIEIVQMFEDANIYIIDIDSSEILSYYYAFNNLSLNVLEYYNIDKIFLITKQWGVICFKNNENMLLHDTNLSKNYVCTRNAISRNISDGIRQMANFLRKYDSWLFWKKLEEMQDEKVFINAEIKWTNTISVKGYLDLDRLYLYEDLYAHLKMALTRLSGLETNNMAEYRSIDVTSNKICRDLNTGLVYREDGRKLVMNVGGVCASGYTKESFYGEQKVDLTFVFFAHPSFNKDFKKDFKDTAYLFIWPKEEYFSNFRPDSRSYIRMGQTNLISINHKEKLIDVENIYRNSIRDKRQIYEDFQQKYPKVVKYGHFQTDKHHYMIGIDINSYMQYSHMKKEGAFLFLLAKVLFYLSKNKEQLAQYIADLDDSSWKNVLENYDYGKFCDRGELIVYHSNTYTEYSMKLLRKIIPEELRSKIVPINFLNVQSKGTPIAFSPFMMDRIKEHYTKGETGILFIDSSLYTGRNLIEIENILLSTGCKEVCFTSLVDMRRLRNADEKSQSYWKLNIPRLDNKTQCVICNTLNIMKQMDNKMAPEARKRIQEWIKNWQYINIANNIKSHGIESTDIPCEDFGGIKIDSTIGLNIYATEHMCESFEDDFVYKHIRTHPELTPKVKMQLISTQLCLFGNQSSRQLQLSLLSELVGNMAKSKDVSSYTSLAGLMLISQSKSTMYELLNEILFLNNDKHILSIRKDFQQSKNIDLAIVIGYFIKTDNIIEALLSQLNDENEEGVIALANKYYLPDKNLKLISKELLGLCVSEQGNSHSTNLDKLLIEHVATISDFEDCCDAVRNDLQSIKELARSFPLFMVSTVVPERFSYRDLLRDIDEIERLMDVDIDSYKRGEFQDGNQIRCSIPLKKSIEKYKKDLDVLLHNFFISSSDEAKLYFRKLCNRYEEIHNKKIKFKFLKQDLKYEKWYYWHSGMEKEFGYFLDNLKHCERLLSTSEDGSGYNMEVIVECNKNSLTLILRSWSNKPAMAVNDKFRKDNRLSKEHSEAFDVNFSFKDIIQYPANAAYLLETKMMIPSCYQILEEKNEEERKQKI